MSAIDRIIAHLRDLHVSAGMLRAFRLFLARDHLAKVGEAMAAMVPQHQSTVPTSAPVLNSGVMPELMFRVAESEPE
jgi:hypothetical protein